MSVASCHICEKNPDEAARLGNSGRSDTICPVCYRQVCRYHSATVRWRWRNPTRDVDSAQVCIECKTAYKHRHWDTINREWIS